MKGYAINKRETDTMPWEVIAVVDSVAVTIARFDSESDAWLFLEAKNKKEADYIVAVHGDDV